MTKHWEGCRLDGKVFVTMVLETLGGWIGYSVLQIKKPLLVRAKCVRCPWALWAERPKIIVSYNVSYVLCPCSMKKNKKNKV